MDSMNLLVIYGISVRIEHVLALQKGGPVDNKTYDL